MIFAVEEGVTNLAAGDFLALYLRRPAACSKGELPYCLNIDNTAQKWRLQRA